LDLFCKAGGASEGYRRAGFDVVGVDIEAQPNYPFEFHQADAIEFVKEYGHEFDAIAASPPCQRYSTMTRDHSKHPDLIGPTREALVATGKPYVIENVQGARNFMVDPVKYCGSSFGLRVRRHRLFESNITIVTPVCDHARQGQAVGIYGVMETRTYLRPDGTKRGRKAQSLEEAQEAMGIDWMTWKELTQAIPPAFTQHIGIQLIRSLTLN